MKWYYGQMIYSVIFMYLTIGVKLKLKQAQITIHNLKNNDFVKFV